ncbi:MULTISPECIES: TOTE conflict system archaeo-eukaryotic primase domain-containing protein [unclassified Synechococcus]|uniref:TOTE conflict system archaeo-eukaryotic primase domain-containing protein n=1 Tax=unclassified Synechococcus TaxID=2626047 RepID=UPI0021A44819|nr:MULTISPECIES: hypothetical protein [unclassified Synechococcus]MCT0212050.1 hypothetical protein [Synechococcus sp. CS-1326]MCT0232952.1 hypothetical protein [Synechococcus sp. CS-1327]
MTLFRRLFHGRYDVYALRWQSSRSGRSGYAPACANEWQPGICEKPPVACRDCGHRRLLPLTDVAIYGHLAGEHRLGLYPLLEDDTCYVLAVDFDEQDWRDDARAVLRSCRELAVPAALEISRSRGGGPWVGVLRGGDFGAGGSPAGGCAAAVPTGAADPGCAVDASRRCR